VYRGISATFVTIHYLIGTFLSVFLLPMLPYFVTKYGNIGNRNTTMTQEVPAE